MSWNFFAKEKIREQDDNYIEHTMKSIDLIESPELDTYGSTPTTDHPMKKRTRRLSKKLKNKDIFYIDLQDSESEPQEILAEDKKNQTKTRNFDRKLKSDSSSNYENLASNSKTHSSNTVQIDSISDYNQNSKINNKDNETNIIDVSNTISSNKTLPSNTTILTNKRFKSLNSQPVTISPPTTTQQYPSHNTVLNQSLNYNNDDTRYIKNNGNKTKTDKSFKGIFLSHRSMSHQTYSSNNTKTSYSNNKSDEESNERKKFCQKMSMRIELGKGRETRRHANGQCGKKMSQEEMLWRSEWADVLWLELKANLNGIPSSTQDLMLDLERRSVPIVLQKLMSFRLESIFSTPVVMSCSCHNCLFTDPSSCSYISSPFTFSIAPSPTNPITETPTFHTTHDSQRPHNSTSSSNQPFISNCKNILGVCLNQEITVFTHAARQVADVMNQVEWVQSLYPNDKALQRGCPQYTHNSLQNRLTCLHMWYDTTLDLVQYIRYVYEMVTCTHVKDADRPKDWSLWWCIEPTHLEKLLYVLKHRKPEQLQNHISKQSSRISAEHYYYGGGGSGEKTSANNSFKIKNDFLHNESIHNNLDILDFFSGKNDSSQCEDEEEDEVEGIKLEVSDDSLLLEQSKSDERTNHIDTFQNLSNMKGLRSTLPSKTSMTSSDSSDFSPSSTTSFYKKFVDRSLKTSEVREFCKRLHKLLERTLNRSRLVLELLYGGSGGGSGGGVCGDGGGSGGGDYDRSGNDDGGVTGGENSSGYGDNGGTDGNGRSYDGGDGDEGCSRKVDFVRGLEETVEEHTKPELKAVFESFNNNETQALRNVSREDDSQDGNKIRDCEKTSSMCDEGGMFGGMDEEEGGMKGGVKMGDDKDGRIECVFEKEGRRDESLKECMKSMNLPSFKPFFIFLAKVLLDVMHEGLKLRLAQQPKNNSSIESLKPLIKQCKDILRASVLTKARYESLTKDLSCGECHEGEMEKFEESLMLMLKIYFDYMNQFISHLQKVPRMSRQLKDFMGREWRFCKEVCSHIHNGEADAGNKFCSMTSSLLRYISDILNSGIDDCTNKLMKYEEGGDKDDEEEDEDDEDEEDDDYDDSVRGLPKSESTLFRHRLLQLGRELKDHFNEARDSSMRTLMFARMIKNDLEVVSQYEVVVPVTKLLQDLEITNHVQIITGQRLNYSIFAPVKVVNDHNLACHLLNVACCSDEHFDDNQAGNAGVGMGVFGGLGGDGDFGVGRGCGGVDASVTGSGESGGLMGDKSFRSGDILKGSLSDHFNNDHVKKDIKIKEHPPTHNNNNNNKDGKGEGDRKLRILGCDSDGEVSKNELQDDSFKEMAFQSLNINTKRSHRGNQYNNYLIFINNSDLTTDSGTPTHWQGSKKRVYPNAEATIALVHVEVEKLILVAVHSSKLQQCRQTLEDCVRGDVRVVDEQTSCHQSIVESLNELKCSALDFQMSLSSGLKNISKRFDSVDLDSVQMDESDSDKLHKDNKGLINYCYIFAFEYHKEVYRLISGKRREDLGKKMVLFGCQWIWFAQSCVMGRGIKPRWAHQAFDFLRFLMDTSDIIDSLSPQQYHDFECCLKKGVGHIVGFSTPGHDVSMQKSPLSDRKISVSQINYTSPSRNRCATPTRSISTAPHQTYTCFKPRRREWRKAIERLDRSLDQSRLSAKRIGQITSRNVNSFSTDFKVRKVKFKWLRGNKIGEGQFGKVFSVINLNTGELFAMKQMKLPLNDYKRMKKIEGEISILESVSHPSIVQFYGTEIFSDELLLFMEFCRNGTLEDLCKEELSEVSIMRYAHNILKAVYFLHSHSIVHRDIKGANIFVMPNHSIKLGDFGCSVQLKTQDTILGELNEFVGTPAFMAPEVINVNAEVGYGRSSDVWSYGCVILQMSTGKRPWHKLVTKEQIIFKVGTGVVPEIPERLSKESKEFIGLCLQSDPHKRATVEHLIDHPFVKVDVDEETDI